MCLRVCQLIGASPASKQAGRDCRLPGLFEVSGFALDVQNTSASSDLSLERALWGSNA